MRIETAFDHREMKRALSEDLRDGVPDRGLRTGMQRWDERMMMEEGGLYTLAGPTNHGKSSLALALAMRAAETGVGVFICSLEDKFRLMTSRIVGWQCGINPRNLRRSVLRPEQHDWVMGGGIDRLPNLNIICRTDRRHIDDIVTSYDAAQELGCKLMVIDYVQGISGGSGDRRIQVGEYCGKIRDAGDRTGIATLLLSQLRRRANETDEPNLSMLKEAGELENASDGVAFIFREETGIRCWVAKHKDDFDSSKWELRRDLNRGGVLVEVGPGGRALEPIRPPPWESDDDQNDSRFGPAVQQPGHQQGGGGEFADTDFGEAPENGAGEYSPGWANRHDVR